MYETFRPVAVTTSGISAPERIYVFLRNQVSIYSPFNNTWTSGNSTPSDRVDAGVVMIGDDTFYAIGGMSNPEHSIGFNSFGPVATNEQYFPIGYGTPDPSYVLEHTPPQMSFQSPLNQTYNDSSVPIVFTVNKNITLTSYSLDGLQNVTIVGNTTLTGLS